MTHSPYELFCDFRNRNCLFLEMESCPPKRNHLSLLWAWCQRNWRHTRLSQMIFGDSTPPRKCPTLAMESTLTVASSMFQPHFPSESFPSKSPVFFCHIGRNRCPPLRCQTRQFGMVGQGRIGWGASPPSAWPQVESTKVTFSDCKGRRISHLSQNDFFSVESKTFFQYLI